MDWHPNLSFGEKPHYLAIADQIAADLKAGRLAAGDRLPPQRVLAKRLGVDFTTIARGYGEARRRGLVDGRVGQGTYVTGSRQTATLRAAGRLSADLSMNLPPEPSDPDLLAMMREGAVAASQDLVGLLRYQRFGGSPADKDAASSWLGRRALVPTQDRLFVTPGAHAALLGILGVLAKPGDAILCEAVTYPGVRAIAAQLGLRLVGLEMDEDGVTPEALEAACRSVAPKAVYLNPTLQNPTTLTIPEDRRAALANVAREYELPIVEDDAYGFIPTRKISPFAAIAPDLTWHVAGLAKCIGAGLRAAYVIAPSARAAWPFVAALRAANVMASPLTVAVATRWIEDGTADAILRFIRQETAARQRLADEILPAGLFRSDPLSFNLWIRLPQPWNRASFAEHLRETGLGVVASDAFTASGAPAEAARVCIGGASTRTEIRQALEFIAHAVDNPPELASSYL